MLQGFFVSIGFFLSFAIGQFLVYRTIKKAVAPIFKELIAAYQAICVLYAVFYYGLNEASWLIFALMILPLAYLLDSNVAFIGYLAAILLWAFYSDQEIIWFYLLVVLAAPYILRSISANRYKLSGQVIAWFMAVYLLIAVAITLKELVYSPLASVVFSSYFCSLYFFDRIFYDPKSSFIFRPFLSIRIVGMVLLAQIFSFDIWGSHLAITWELIQEYSALFVLIGLSFFMLRNIKKDISAIVFGGYFLLNILCYLLTYIQHPFIPILVALFQSVYSVMMGIALITEAKQNHNLLLYLGGTGIIVLQIIFRVTELGVMWAVPALIVAVWGYIFVNYRYLRRWQEYASKNNTK